MAIQRSKVLKTVFPFALVSLSACTTDAVTPVVSRPAAIERFLGDGLTDYYVKFVEQGRFMLRAGRLEWAEWNFRGALGAGLPERANYEVWIELAEVNCRLGKTAEARGRMQDYGIALKIALKQEPCLEDWAPEMRVSPNPRIPLLMYGIMCNPRLQAYSYVDMTDQDRAAFAATYNEMSREASNLEEQCEALSE